MQFPKFDTSLMLFHEICLNSFIRTSQCLLFIYVLMYLLCAQESILFSVLNCRFLVCKGKGASYGSYTSSTAIAALIQSAPIPALGNWFGKYPIPSSACLLYMIYIFLQVLHLI